MSAILKLNIVGTGMFVVSATASAVFFTPYLRATGVFVSLVLFTVGVASFIWGYFTAAQRSRYDDISVASLYLLLGHVCSAKIRRLMNGSLIVQGLCGLATALARTSTNGRAGSTLAFGVLVPLFGLGLNGLWSSRHGSFSPRDNSKSLTPNPAIGKDGVHG
ncbi:MAG: hypothetical protein ABIQ38_02550 [Ilumatobacteraceae bacterium]